jgi:ribosome-associated protein
MYVKTHEAELNPEHKTILKTIIEALEDKKADDIKTLAVGNLVNYADYLVLCTAGSDPQVRALTDEVESRLKKLMGLRPILSAKDINWFILDYVDIVVHVFKPEARNYYDLDMLWEDAPRIEPQT